MKQARMLRALVAAVILGTIVTPIAVAGAQGQRATRPTAQARALKLLKGLKKETAAISGEIASLRAKIGVLEAPKPPAPAPPNGPAGGDLAGTYPNPKVRASSITSAQVADNAITSADIAANTIQTNNIADGGIGSADIADGSIGQADLGSGSVAAPQLVSTHVVIAGPTAVGNGGSALEVASCPAGERLLSGGGGWSEIKSGLFILASKPDENVPNQWNVVVKNSSGATTGFRVFALCLRAG